ncbi:MAG: uroporphyrinogen-III C-methyltransferase [Lentisphaerales bacterium]|nr:uroporphyrinogen-III C-methyltransferase [Lentisphaerales bacterium]
MLISLKHIEIALNSTYTQEGISQIQSSLENIQLTTVTIKDNETASFHTLLSAINSDKADFFFWDASDYPETAPEGTDFFFIPKVDTAVIFKRGNADLELIRSFFAPPVVFVGGGPGDHEWLTVEAKIILDHCDIVFYDALVNPLIVASLHEDVERFYVGKRGDSTSFNQNELNQLIALYARKGYKVGRLKGGDPSVLGRITEEIDTLNECKLSYQITPGISAMQALSACAGIFLTQRGVCDRVTLTTARSAGGKLNNLLPFNEASLVVYMGILSASKIRDQLLDAGYSANLPTAIMMNLTRCGQKVIHSTLDKFADTIKKQNLRPPGLLVFGKTAAKDLHRIPAYSPLAGRRILLLNSETEALKIARRIRRWGGKPVFLYNSLLTLDGESIMPEYDDIIFQSPREVSTFYDLMEGPKIAAETKIISVGEEVDAAFNCLFRRHSTIVPSYREAISKLRQELLQEFIK